MFIKRVVWAGALATVLTAAIVVSPAVGIGEASLAHARCQSTISPTCQPANNGWLAEAGVIALDNYPTATNPETTVGKQPGGKGGSKLGWVFDVVNTVAGWTGFDVTQWFTDPDTGEEKKGSGVLTDRGVQDQEVKPPERFEPEVESVRVNRSEIDSLGVWRNLKPWTATSWEEASQNVDSFVTLSIVDVKFPTPYQVQFTTTIRNKITPNSTGTWIFDATWQCLDPATGNLRIGRHMGSSRWYHNVRMDGDTRVQNTVDCLRNEIPWAVGFTDAPRPGSGVEPSTPQYVYGGQPVTNNSLWLNPSNPLRSDKKNGEYKRELRCKDGNGVVSTLKDSTEMVLGGATVALPDLVCPDGSTAIGLDTGWQSQGGPEVPITPKGSLVAPPNVPSELTRPECRDGECIVELKRDGDPCGITAENCLDWAQDWQANPQRYKCYYGGLEVSINVCSMYRAPTMGILPNVTPEGELMPPNSPKPDSWKNPVRPPANEPDNPTNPNPNPSAPGVGTPGSQINPGDACMAQWGQTLNPIDWVFHPVKCALVAMFQPREAIVGGHIRSLEGKWNGTSIGRIVNALTAWEFFAPSNGCGGINVAVSKVWPGTSDFRILNACPGEQLHGTAVLASVVIGIFAVIGSIVSVTRSIGGIVGYGGLTSGEPQ